MLVKNAISLLVAASTVAEAAITYRAVSHADVHAAGRLSARQDNARQGNNGKNNNNNGKNNNGNQGGNNGGNAGGNAGGNCLAADAVQNGSNQAGQPAAGQSDSITDANNFINFCQGKGTLTNGEQVTGGSCNGIPMGQIPSTGNMVSTKITNPQNMGNIAAEQTFDVELQVDNMVLGTFTDPQRTYYSAPQQLQGGKVVGHTHVTIQDVGNDINRATPMNPQQFAFFKGVNDAGNGNGGLSATVDGGLPAGNYRACTMSGASNHQPVLMPVAQRGSQEDCIYFTVGGNGGGNNNNAGGQNGGNNNAGKNNNAGGNAGNAGNNAGNGGQNNNAGGQNGGNNNAGKNNNAGGNAGGAGNQAGNNNQNQGKNNGGNGNAGNAGNQAGNGQNGGNQGQGNGTETGAGQQPSNGEQGAGAGSGAGNNAGNGNNGNAGNGGNGGAGALGGVAAPAVTDSGNAARPFSVNGDTFVNEGAAKQRACAIQNNQCADLANRGGAAFTVGDCNTQQTACNAA